MLSIIDKLMLTVKWLIILIIAVIMTAINTSFSADPSMYLGGVVGILIMWYLFELFCTKLYHMIKK